MPLVAAVPPAPTDLAWRVIGLVNLYRLLIPPALYAAVFLLRRERAGRQRPTRSCSSGPAWCISPLASRSSSAAVACCPICGRPPSSTPWWTPWPSACCCSASGGVASGLGILFVVPVGAMALLADSRDAFLLAALATLALFAQQIGGTCHRRLQASTTIRRRHPRRHRVPGGAAGLADGARACATPKPRCGASRWTSPISRSFRSTSCRTCARASSWSTTRTASA